MTSSSYPNRHVSYEGDDPVGHVPSIRCPCGVTWKASWSNLLASVVWTFIHRHIEP